MSCSPILEVCQLEDIRSIVVGMLPDKSDVYRLRSIGAGVDNRPKGRERFPDDYVHHLSDEPISVSLSRQPVENVQGTQVRVKGEWILTFEAGKDVDSKDVVVVTTLSNRTFNVIGLREASDEILRTFEASEIV